MMTSEQARRFASRWLPAWTGNDPERLAAFYTDDVFYRDPTVPAGVSGKPEFVRYLRRLLGNNPDWVWTQVEAIPMQDGFLNRWHAEIPLGDEVVSCDGVCTVQMREQLIYRNEVYFDTHQLRRARSAQLP